MPWVHVTTGQTIGHSDREKTASAIAKVLEEVIAKDPKGVFVSFGTADEFFWGGVSSPGASIFDVRWIGEFSADQKNRIAARICGEIAPATGIDGTKTRVVFTSKVSEDWGRPG